LSKWKYYVNDVEQTFWRRVYPTKTFKVASVIVLGYALAAVKGEISYKAALAAASTGAAVVVIRAAMTKLELSQNAANDSLPNVTARPS